MRAVLRTLCGAEKEISLRGEPLPPTTITRVMKVRKSPDTYGIFGLIPGETEIVDERVFDLFEAESVFNGHRYVYEERYVPPPTARPITSDEGALIAWWNDLSDHEKSVVFEALHRMHEPKPQERDPYFAHLMPIKPFDLGG